MERHILPAGLLGTYYSKRHAYGHYRSSGTAGRYNLLAKKEITWLLKHALTKAIERHPSLCYGITEQRAASEAEFIRLQAIDWDDVVEILTMNPETDGGEDAILSKQIGIGHQHLWTDPHHKPAWKVIVLNYTNGSPVVDIAFMSHHAIADCTSGSAFHMTLLAALSEACSISDLHATWPFIVPSNIAKPLLVEAFPIFPPERDSPSTTNRSASGEPIDAWTAVPPLMPSIDEYVSRVVFATIPSTQVRNIVQACRQAQITLTGLLHGLIISHLSRTVEEARGFKAVTLYSMRRFTKVSPEELVNHISYITTDWKESLVESIRRTIENSEEEERVVSLIAEQYQAEMTEELARVPVEGPAALIEISKIKDLDQFCQDGMKGKRGYTYELSNIGVVKMPEIPQGSGMLLEKLVFTQCGMVTGPALGCSVVTVGGGPMVVSLHWQEGVLGDDFMEDMKAFLERRLMAMRS